MTIRRGQHWGEAGPLHADCPVAASDAELTALVRDAVPSGAAVECGLIGGDLHASMGSPRHDVEALRAGAGMRFPVDIGEAVLRWKDGRTQKEYFAAHLVAVEGGGPIFSHRTVVVMNASHRGTSDLGPRAHPNDGLLDVTEGRLGTWDRVRARRRLPTGSHLPHPDLSTSRVHTLEVSFQRPARLSLDDRDLGWVDSLVIRCLPDAATVVV